MLTIRRATHEDAVDLAKRLRAADLLEIQAAGSTPESSLLSGLESPDPCYVAEDPQGVVHIMWGTSPSDEPFLGFVWMLASDGIKDHWVQILRETRPMVDTISGNYRILANAVHAKNTTHIRWLRWAGFTLIREIEFNGQPFYEFAKLIYPEGQ